MGAIFSPCLALAWLLTSRIALRNCETLLACGVLREEDLDGAFRGDEEIVGDSHEMALAFVEASTHRPSPPTSTRCCIEAILQGLAALEVRFCFGRPVRREFPTNYVRASLFADFAHFICVHDASTGGVLPERVCRARNKLRIPLPVFAHPT